MPRALPPKARLIGTDRILQKLLRGTFRNTRSGSLKRQHLPLRTGKQENIARGKPPDLSGGVLNGRRIASRHQRFQAGKAGEQLGGSGEIDFALSLYILKNTYRIAQVNRNFLLQLHAHSAMNHPQRGAGKTCGNHKQGKQKFGPQPNAGHSRPPAFPSGLENYALADGTNL